MVRPRKGARDTRQVMLEAAIAAIDEGGVESIRTKAIASAADVTEPSLFHFFGNRDGLVEAALAERFLRSQADFFGDFRDSVFKCRTKREFIALTRGTWQISASPARRHARRVRVETLAAVQAHPNLGKFLAEAQEQANAILIETLEHAQTRKWVRRDINLDAAAIWIVAQGTGIAMAEVGSSNVPYTELGDLIGEAVVNYLLPPT